MNENDELRKEQLVEIRQKQFQMAMDGNVQMLIWLGKQYLGQKDSPEFMTDELCDGFDLEVIDDDDGKPFDKIVYSECKNKECQCVDCRKENRSSRSIGL